MAKAGGTAVGSAAGGGRQDPRLDHGKTTQAVPRRISRPPRVRLAFPPLPPDSRRGCHGSLRNLRGRIQPALSGKQPRRSN